MLTQTLKTDVPVNLRSSNLKWNNSSPEQLLFMQKVYDINLFRLLSIGRKIKRDLPENELVLIESDKKAKAEVAKFRRALLEAVRQTIKENGLNVEIGVESAYRSPSKQFSLWQQYFPIYYQQTEQERKNTILGEHSDEAAELLAAYIRKRIAMPGFSNHNDGTAIDFSNKENGVYYKNNSLPDSIRAWNNSWFWNWLVENAALFSFYQNNNIDEPWHWEYKTNYNINKLNEVNNSEFFNLLETSKEATKKLKCDNVHFLAFEGGGGKGIAYLGAVKALEELSILKHTPKGRLDPNGRIKGVAGSSAGALTALLLTVGYNSNDLSKLFNGNLNVLVDPPFPFKTPTIESNDVVCVEGSQDIFIENFVHQIWLILGTFLKNNFPEISKEPFAEVTVNALNIFLKNYIKYKAQIAVKEEREGTEKKLGDNIKENFFFCAANTFYDYGLFSGCNLHKFIQDVLFGVSGNLNLTFAEHYKEFGIMLVLTGTNLETNKVGYFSCKTTPNLPVATAVRISMGFPLLFKPIKISEQFSKYITSKTKGEGNNEFAGLWVDGGVKENIPLLAFEDKFPFCNSFDKNNFNKPHTLGLRLDLNGPKRIYDLFSYFNGLTDAILSNSEESASIKSQYAEQCIQLNTIDLSTLNFNSDYFTKKKRILEAKQSVLEYFSKSECRPTLKQSATVTKEDVLNFIY